MLTIALTVTLAATIRRPRSFGDSYAGLLRVELCTAGVVPGFVYEHERPQL